MIQKKKKNLIKENPIVSSKTVCSICGFLLDVHATGKHKRLYDFIAECEHLFLRNIYCNTDLQEMKIDDIEKYYETFDRLVELFPVVERALEDETTSPKFEDFMLEELGNLYSTAEELKETIDMLLYLKEDLLKLILQIK